MLWHTKAVTTHDPSNSSDSPLQTTELRPRPPRRVEISNVTSTRPAPSEGESITFTVAGLPPKQGIYVPLGAPRNQHDSRFRILRHAAITAVDGRAPYNGPVTLTLVLPTERDRTESGIEEDYAWGVVESLIRLAVEDVADTPIVFYEKSQITDLRVEASTEPADEYTVMVTCC